MSTQKIMATLLVVFALVGQQAAAHFIEDVPANEADQAAAHGKRIPSRGSKAKSKSKAAKAKAAVKAKAKAKNKLKAKSKAKKPKIAAGDLGSSTSSSYPSVVSKPLSQPTTTKVTTHKVTVMPVVFATHQSASNPPDPEIQSELNALYPVSPAPAPAPAQVSASVAPPRSEGQVSTFSLVPAVGYQNFEWAGTNASSGSFTSLGGYSVGASVLLGADNLHYETGLYYAERGIGYDGYLRGAGNVQSSPVKGAIEFRASYLEIPAFVRYAFFHRERTHVFLKAGAVLDVLQSSSSTIDYKNSVGTLGVFSNATSEDTFSASMRETDLRWAVGGGGVVKIWDRISVTGQGLYERSFSSINKSGMSNFLNAGFSLQLGALIEL
jgi:hypothetical protein